MKQITNAKTFTAYATVDAGYYMLQQLAKEIPVRKSGIEWMVDAATGYGDFLTKNLARNIIPIVEDIIKAKKFLKHDSTGDEKLLAAAKEALTK